MKWNSILYDNKHDFVSKYGEDLLRYIHHLWNGTQWIADYRRLRAIAYQ